MFDSNGKKNVFKSTSSTIEVARSFTGTIPSGGKPKYVLWTGKLQNDDNTILTETSDALDSALGSETIVSGGSATLDTKAGGSATSVRFSGSCLAVSSTQTINYQNSFVADGNISIMKEGDSCLKSVFGYLRYRIPVSDQGNYATIKSIKITADENIAGQVEIDYSGNEPVASIVSKGSRSITVNTRWQSKTSSYEPGLYYAILPVGKYHNVSVEITTFNGAASSYDAPTNAPFTIYCRGEVVVERGRYTDLGTDIVLIQFMHNDKNSSRDGYRTDAATTYKDNLRKFISEVREKGGVPVLVTSLLPRQFNDDGTAKRILGDFPDAMRAVAQETETPLVDVEQWSYDWLTELGEDGSVPYYLMDKREPDKMDNVHITTAGADVFAKYIADELVRLGVWTR